MDLFHKVTDETTLLITRSDSDSPIIRCTLDYKAMWLTLYESAGNYKSDQSIRTVSQEVKAFLRFLDQYKLLPGIDLNTAQSILGNFSLKMPPEGKFEVMDIITDVQVLANAPPPGSMGSTYDPYLGCFTPGDMDEDACPF